MGNTHLLKGSVLTVPLSSYLEHHDRILSFFGRVNYHRGSQVRSHLAVDTILTSHIFTCAR
jgi:hypothetical protein